MKHWKKATVSLLILALLALPLLGLLGCGKKETGTVTIKVGYLTDLTGVASPAMGPNQWAILDCWEYMEKTDPIPGAKLKLVSYDTAFDPGRFIPGYEWLKSQGVVVTYSYMPQVTDTIVQFLARDKMTVFSHTLDAVSAASPWVFDSGMMVEDQYDLSLKWLSDHWPNYSTTKPKIGIVGWDTSYEVPVFAAMKAYVQSHPDKFDLVGSYAQPAGTVTWSGVVRALKGCDYVCPVFGGGTGYSSFISQFRAAGGTATFFGGEGMPCWTSLIIPTSGWEAMDGSFNAITWGWYTGPSPTLIAVARDALARRGKTELSLGYGYFSQVVAQVFWYELLKAAVEEVGAENVDSQSIYNTATKFHYTIEGMPEMSYSETNRVNTHSGMIYEWSAEASDLVPISDWLLAPER
jgi:ABC-type branched-subunit amino acid transport system substrate-binding protein